MRIHGMGPIYSWSPWGLIEQRRPCDLRPGDRENSATDGEKRRAKKPKKNESNASDLIYPLLYERVLLIISIISLVLLNFSSIILTTVLPCTPSFFISARCPYAFLSASSISSCTRLIDLPAFHNHQGATN